MGYFTIGKHKVLYTKVRFREVDEPFQEKHNANGSRIDMLGVDGKPSAEKIALRRLQVEFLENELATNPYDFVEKWVKFDLTTDAKSEAWFIITDYLAITKNGQIQKSSAWQDRERKLSLNEWEVSRHHFPQGQIVDLIFELNTGVGSKLMRKLFPKN